MTEKIHEQISAFIDDELSAEEGAFLIRRLVSDGDARGQLARYAVIGSALRGDLMRADESVLRCRIQASLGGPVAEPVKSEPRKPDKSSGPARVVAAASVAAAVAAFALFGLRTVNQAGPEAPVSGEPSVESASTFLEPPSYVVPQDFTEGLIQSPDIRLTNYLMQHGSFASPFSRVLMHTNMVGPIESEMGDEEAAIPGVQW
jgi:hypothetical protein